MMKRLAEDISEKYIPKYFFTITLMPIDSVKSISNTNYNIDLQLPTISMLILNEINRAIGNQTGKHTEKYPYIMVSESDECTIIHFHGIFFESPYCDEVWKRKSFLEDRVVKLLKKRGFKKSVCKVEEVKMPDNVIDYVFKTCDNNCVVLPVGMNL